MVSVRILGQRKQGHRTNNPKRMKQNFNFHSEVRGNRKTVVERERIINQIAVVPRQINELPGMLGKTNLI